MDITTDIRPISEFKQNASEIMEQVKATGRPVVITKNGTAEMVVLSAKAYQEILDDEYRRNVQEIQNGLDAFAAGKGIPASEFFKKLKGDLGI